MAGRSRILLGGAGLFVAAVLGAGLALGGAALFGDLGKTTTIREIQAAASPAGATATSGSGARTSINDIYKRAAPGVVQVTSTTIVNVPSDPFFGNPLLPQQQRQQSLGSGFVVDKAGHIVTNFHVVDGAKQVRVSFSNGASMKATVVGTDPSSDLAVLKIDASSRALTPLALGDSDQIKVGDAVVAIGNPFGLDRTVTSGIVSAIQRAITAPNGYTIDHVIQTDASINHGNSGGPLLNGRGEVIGVNSQIESDSGGNDGVGFAVPSITISLIVGGGIDNGSVQHAYLGIAIDDSSASAGASLAEVRAGTPAARAGLKNGDVITKFGDQSVGSADELRRLVDSKQPGDKVELTVTRNGKTQTITVTLGTRPSA